MPFFFYLLEPHHLLLPTESPILSQVVSVIVVRLLTELLTMTMEGMLMLMMSTEIRPLIGDIERSKFLS